MLLCVTMWERARPSTWSYSLVYNFLIYFLPLNISYFVVHFSNAFWHRHEAFSKGSSLQSITCHIVNIGVWKYVVTSALIKIKTFHSCRTRVIRVALVSHSCRSRFTRVTLALLMLHSCCIRIARAWRSCCKLD